MVASRQFLPRRDEAQREPSEGVPGRRSATAQLGMGRDAGSPRDPAQPSEDAAATAGERAERAEHSDPFDFSERAMGKPGPALPQVPAGTILRHGGGAGGARGGGGGTGGAQTASRNVRPRGPVLHLRWRGTARASYQGFFRNITADRAQSERWIDHLLAAETRWQYRGQDVALDEFERLANENHLQILPVFGGALPYIESVTNMHVAQLESINREVTRAEQAAETALAHLDQIEQGNGVGNGVGGGRATVPGGTEAGGGGDRPAHRDTPLAAAPSELRGPGRCVVGGRASYEMRVTLGANDTSDNPLEDSRAIDRGTFTFEVFDATALARASNGAAAETGHARVLRRASPGGAAAVADPLAAQTAALRQGGNASGGRTVTSADATDDSLGRIDRTLSGDAARAAGEYDEARRDGRTTDAIIGATNVLLTPTSAAVAYGGYVLDRVVDGLFGTAHERAIPFPAAGTFIVRCIAQPLRLDGQAARPASVAVHVVEVAEAGAMAREALDEPAARIAELELRRDQAGDPGERVAAEQALATARTLAQGSPAAVIGLSRDRLVAERQRLNAEIARVAARPAPNADEVFSRQSELRNLRAQLEDINTQLATVQTQLELATTRHGELGSGAFRPHAVIVDEESGDRMELLLEVSEPLPQADGYHCSVSDTTSAHGHMFRGVAPTRTEAIWAALRAVANGNDYGRGRLFVRIPDSVALGGGRDRDFTNAPGSTTLLRARLADLGTVATALASVSVPGASEVAMFVGAATAATNLATRLSEHTLHLDAEAVNDVLNVLTAAAAGVRTIGRLRIDPSAVSGRIALVPVEASAVARAAQGVSTAIDRVQVITTTMATMQQFDDVARQEASGSISHARARELRARALIGHVQLAWTTTSMIAGAAGGDGTTGDGVIHLADEPANANAHASANAQAAGAPPVAAAGREPQATAQPAAVASAGPSAAGPHPGPSTPEVDGGGGVDPHHRDALVPPPPQGAEQANVPSLVPTLVPPPPQAQAQPPSAQPAHPQGAEQANVPSLVPTLVPPPPQAQAQPPSAQPAHPQGAEQANIPTLVPPPPPQQLSSAAHAPTLVPPPPANDLEAHQLARAARVAPLILTLPAGTRVVPDATPGPLPAGWMRLSDFSAYLRMIGRLRTTAPGRDILHAIANQGGTITMNAGVGHFQNGTHINIDPHAHGTATGRAGAVGHEGDHLTRRGAAPTPQGHATEDSYVDAVMQHEALAQARLLELRRAMMEADGHRVAPDGSNVNEAGSAAYYPAYQRAHRDHLAAHPGDTEGAHNAGIDAGVAALAAMWRGVIVSIPGAGTYDQYARRNYRAVRGQQAQPQQPVDPAQVPSTLPPPPPAQGERTTLPGY